jgi:membrane protease YdiL (CAAX protease family)
VLFALALVSVTGVYLDPVPFMLREAIFAARQFLVLVLVLLAVGLSGHIRLLDLLGCLPSTWMAARVDASIGIAVAGLCWKAWDYLALIVKPPAGGPAFVPQGKAEIVCYLMMGGLVAPFIEEIVVRGYLQQQFAAVTHSQIAGVVVQAIAWGAAHGYQGGTGMLMIAALGVPFGLLALWRRSLVPGIVAHCAFNIFVLMSWCA